MTSAARALTCPNCGGTIAVKAAGYSVSVGCQHCGALLDVANPDVTVIEQYESAMRDLPIPLGRRGTLFGTEWEAVGALARSDGDVDWTETLLFNPYAGYRWLVLSEGEWTFGTMLADRPRGIDGATIWRGNRFSQDYDPAETTTIQVIGEFYWRVQAGDVVTATTFSRGDQLLSAEWTADEINWTHLVPVSGSEIARAFGFTPGTGGNPGGAFGRKGMAQGFATPQAEAGPNRYQPDLSPSRLMAPSDVPKMLGYAAITLLLSMLVMIGFGLSTASVKNSAEVEVDGREVSVTLGTLTIRRPHQAVTIEARASSFENRWIDIDYTLVDRKTQRGYTAYGVVEHYAGRDSDGPWTEGSYRTVTKLSSIPSGTYEIIADLQAHSWSNSSYSGSSYSSPAASSNPWASEGTPSGTGERISIDLSASAGGIMWSNLWIEVMMLFGLPLLIWWWRNQSEAD